MSILSHPEDWIKSPRRPPISRKIPPNWLLTRPLDSSITVRGKSTSHTLIKGFIVKGFEKELDQSREEGHPEPVSTGACGPLTLAMRLEIKLQIRNGSVCVRCKYKIPIQSRKVEKDLDKAWTWKEMPEWGFQTECPEWIIMTYLSIILFLLYTTD